MTTPNMPPEPVPAGPHPAAGSLSDNDHLKGPFLDDPATFSTHVRACLARDKEECILTKDGTIEVVSICPESITEIRPSSSSGNFWAGLRLFKSEETVKKWEQALFPNGEAHRETCANMLCLSPTALAYFNKTYFALKPHSLSEDKKKLVLHFFWLAQNQSSTPIDVRPSLQTAGGMGPNNARLLNRQTSRPIRSGDEIVMETDDPVNRPLPDLDILEMQWFMQRAAAIAGAPFL